MLSYFPVLDILWFSSQDSVNTKRWRGGGGMQEYPDDPLQRVKDLNCSLPVLKALAQDSCRLVRAAVAKHPKCSLALLRQLAKDPEPFVRAEVARRLRGSLHLFETLLQNQAPVGEWHVSCALAENPHCPPSILAELARSPNYFVREQVASNSSCPETVLAYLASDLYPSVRERVAKNPLCPPFLLLQLSQDPDVCIRTIVLDHPQCPNEVFIRLCQDVTLSPYLVRSLEKRIHQVSPSEALQLLRQVIEVATIEVVQKLLPLVQDLEKNQEKNLKTTVFKSEGEQNSCQIEPQIEPLSLFEDQEYNKYNKDNTHQQLYPSPNLPKKLPKNTKKIPDDSPELPLLA